MTFYEINGGSGPSGITPGGINPVEQSKKQAKEAFKLPEEQKARQDNAEISPDAAEISRYQEMVALHREAYGTSERSAKLDEVRRKIAQGFYDDPDTIDQLASKMVEESMGDAGKANDLNVVRRRTEEGYYDRPEVINRTAENMLKDVIPKREK